MRMSISFALILCIFCGCTCYGQIITTVAGGGYGVDGIPATDANIDDPVSLVFDKSGNIFISEQTAHRIRKVDASTGIISTYAGANGPGYGGDHGPATAAIFNQPNGITFDTSGNLLITDGINNRLRKIDARTGIITTICGNGVASNSGDGGPASAATLYNPNDVKFDNFGNLYIACYNGGVIRKINRLGVISTYAGNGTGGYSGDGGAATNAEIAPANLCFDKYNNMYLCDPSVFGGSIRKINSSGIISLVAGVPGSYIYNGDGIPATSAHINTAEFAIGPDGLFYIGDAFNNRLRMIDSRGIIHTIAGTGVRASTGDGGLADTAMVNDPAPIVFDSCGNLYFAEINTGKIRKITYPHCGYLEIPEIPMPQAEFSIYPNPVVDELYIERIENNSRYQVTDITGKILLNGILGSGHNTISMLGVLPGTYFLSVISEAGERRVQRVVKQ